MPTAPYSARENGFNGELTGAHAVTAGNASLHLVLKASACINRYRYSNAHPACEAVILQLFLQRIPQAGGKFVLGKETREHLMIVALQ